MLGDSWRTRRNSVSPSTFGQADVAQHDVEDVRRDQGQPLGAVGGQRHAMAGVAQRVAHEHPEIGLVVNQQDVEHVRLRVPVTCGDDLRIRKSDLHPKYVFSRS